MPPLAQRIVNELTLPLSLRSNGDECDITHKMSDVHCFDVTEVQGLLQDLKWKIRDGISETGRLAFLPAPKTWIEVNEDFGDDCQRKGWLLVESPDGGTTKVFCAQEFVDDHPIGETYEAWEGDEDLLLFSDENSRGSAWTDCGDIWPEGDEDMKGHEAAWLHAALAVINTPKFIGRRSHHPNRTLERKLLSKHRMIGKFPLHAWTEIVLEVSPPKLDEDDPQETHLTGQRALHFCRSHLRVRLGHLEVVKSHWRGDPALGIKQSRYRLTASRAA